MPTATTTTLPLTIRLTEAQLGYLAYRYPETDPEDALILLLERERVRSLKRANERVEVIRLDEESTTPETEPDLPTESDNPIGTIQEYCQKNQLPIAANKKKAKTEAAGVLLGMLHRLSFNKNEKIGVDQECQGQRN